jgi:uncharacterized membrane protein
MNPVQEMDMSDSTRKAERRVRLYSTALVQIFLLVTVGVALALIFAATDRDDWIATMVIIAAGFLVLAGLLCLHPRSRPNGLGMLVGLGVAAGILFILTLVFLIVLSSDTT